MCWYGAGVTAADAWLPKQLPADSASNTPISPQSSSDTIPSGSDTLAAGSDTIAAGSDTIIRTSSSTSADCVANATQAAQEYLNDTDSVPSYTSDANRSSPTSNVTEAKQQQHHHQQQQHQQEQSAANTVESTQITDIITKPTNVPNLLQIKGAYRDVISFDDTSTPHKRLAMFGGFQGILSHMRADGVVPDLKTFTMLLQCLPPDAHTEDVMHDVMLKLKVCTCTHACKNA